MNSNDKDEFWDLSKLVPKKRPLASFATESAIKDYCVTGEDNVKALGENALTFPDEEKSENDEIVYTPAWSPLIKRVKVNKKTDKFDFYDSFRKAAVLYFDVTAERCDFAQFYSYMPQYSQLRDSQKNYYFYWRSEMRKGRFIKTDYSYLYLAVYEIINLPDLIPPMKGIRILTDLWRAYRKDLPRIDLYFSIWVQDYCLVHRLPCPTDLIKDFIFDVLPASPLKEFYITDISDGGEKGLLTLLAYISSYDYRKGKFALGNPDIDENGRKRQAEMYRAHMNGSLLEVFKNNVRDSFFTADTDGVKVIVRDSFPNSLATHTVKSRLEIEYYSLADNPSLNEKITAAVRYAENRMRALIGVKSRLSVKGLPDEYKSTLDGYFDALDARERTIRAKENEPAYEKLYAAPKEKLSVESADKIETISWMTTARLIEEDEDENLDDGLVSSGEKNVLEKAQEHFDDGHDMQGLSLSDLAFIAYLAGIYDDTYGNLPSGFSREDAKDRINEAFVDFFGDILIEEVDGEYEIIEDYLEDAKEWLLKIRE